MCVLAYLLFTTRFPNIKPFVYILLISLDFVSSQIYPLIIVKNIDVTYDNTVLSYATDKIIDRVFILLISLIAYYKYFKILKNDLGRQ